MSDVLKIDVAGWVERAKSDPVAYRQRQVTEIALNAIASISWFNAKLYLKGGILMGLAYDSPRQTTDIDLTAAFEASEAIIETIRDALDAEFPKTAARLGYADLVLKIHSIKGRPKDRFPSAMFPALKMKIAFANRGGGEERGLRSGKPSSTIEADISFNEPVEAIDVLELTGGAYLHAYGLSELIAEKLRAMLQQVSRRKNRRQDVYDIHLLLQQIEFNDEQRKEILDLFIAKSKSRILAPNKQSLDDPEVKRRSGADWDTLKLELGDVPGFEDCFSSVVSFYRSLPW